MKRLLLTLLAVLISVTLLAGCAGMQKVTPSDPGSIGALLSRAEKCPIDNPPTGTRTLTIPPKNPPADGEVLIYLIVYVYKGGYGFGAYANSGYYVLEKQPDGKWVFGYNGMGQYCEEKNMAEAWNEWATMFEKYDLDKAVCGIIDIPEETPKEKI